MPPSDPLRRLCGKEETIRDADALLNLAKARTSAGSGRSLGGSAVSLPAICAFLASERLGNNDVTEKIAQETSCLDPKRFKAALNTVRNALADQLDKRRNDRISYKGLCSQYGIDDTAVRWMEQVEKEARSGGHLSHVKTSKKNIICAVFYWTCIKLNIRAVKSRAIMRDHDLDPRDFQDTEDLVEDSCQGLIGAIEESLKEARESRFSPMKQTPVAGTPSKQRTTNILDSSPLKRKTPAPAAFPASLEKRLRTASPTKLNRIPVTPAKPTPNRAAVASGSTPSTPLRTYGSNRSFKDTEFKPERDSENIAEDCTNDSSIMHPVVIHEKSAETTQLTEINSSQSGTPVKRTTIRDAKAQESLSPAKSTQNRSKSPEISSSADISTPTTRRMARTTRMAHHEREQPKEQTTHVPESDHSRGKQMVKEARPPESGSEESRPHPCRHRIPAFADRLFYHYKDPRILREWEICERNLKTLVAAHGSPLGTPA